LFRERGSEIVTYLDGVPSRTEEGGFYHVDLDAETCECPDATCRPGTTCLHAFAAMLKASEIRRRGEGDQAVPRPSRRCERKAA
jgi:hypothetical protein